MRHGLNYIAFTPQLKIEILLEVVWEKLPNDFVLDDDPVDNILQPEIAAALTESLQLAGRLSATTLTLTNYGICATVNRKVVVKAPDWDITLFCYYAEGKIRSGEVKLL